MTLCKGKSLPLSTFVGRSFMLFTPEITSFLKIGYFRSGSCVFRPACRPLSFLLVETIERAIHSHSPDDYDSTFVGWLSPSPLPLPFSPESFYSVSHRRRRAQELPRS